MSNKKEIPFSEFEINKTFDFGKYALSEEQIITYANQWDPLPFHISKEAGENSIFKGIIASGPQIFHEIHRHYWLPLFGHSVVCGLEVTNWHFLLPIYPNQIIKSQITITNIEEQIAKKHAKVSWFYEFLNTEKKAYQTLEMTILHKMA